MFTDLSSMSSISSTCTSQVATGITWWYVMLKYESPDEVIWLMVDDNGSWWVPLTWGGPKSSNFWYMWTICRFLQKLNIPVARDEVGSSNKRQIRIQRVRFSGKSGIIHGIWSTLETALYCAQCGSGTVWRCMLALHVEERKVKTFWLESFVYS